MESISLDMMIFQRNKKPSIQLLLCSFILMLQSLDSLAQTKYEREYKLNKSEIPEAAQSFIDACQFSSKVKWYGEESQDGRSIEAKTNKKGKKFSLEFNLEGKIADVEWEVEKTQIETKVLNRIKEELGQIFSKYKLQKIQIQWTGDQESLINLVRGLPQTDNFVQKYEWIIKGKKDKLTAMYELLFGPEGKLEYMAKIQTRNTDNMDY